MPMFQAEGAAGLCLQALRRYGRVRPAHNLGHPFGDPEIGSERIPFAAVAQW